MSDYQETLLLATIAFVLWVAATWLFVARIGVH